MSGWIGVDLDRTLAEYDEWRGELHIGKPIMPMINRVKIWLEQGRDVRIFTARVHDDENNRDVTAIVTAIQDWTQEHLGVRLPVTNKKDYDMHQLWDDRSLHVIPNVGISISDIFVDEEDIRRLHALYANKATNISLSTACNEHEWRYYVTKELQLAALLEHL